MLSSLFLAFGAILLQNQDFRPSVRPSVCGVCVCVCGVCVCVCVRARAASERMRNSFFKPLFHPRSGFPSPKTKFSPDVPVRSILFFQSTVCQTTSLGLPVIHVLSGSHFRIRNIQSSCITSHTTTLIFNEHCPSGHEFLYAFELLLVGRQAMHIPLLSLHYWSR